MQPDNQQQGSSISNIEWGLVIGAVVVIDLVEFGLDWIGIGLVANEFIDIWVGMALPFYFYMRGVTPDRKKLITWIVGPIFEMLTDGLIPVGWTADVVITMLLDKADHKARKMALKMS